MQIGKQPALQLVIAGSSPVTVEHYKWVTSLKHIIFAFSLVMCFKELTHALYLQSFHNLRGIFDLNQIPIVNWIFKQELQSEITSNF